MAGLLLGTSEYTYPCIVSKRERFFDFATNINVGKSPTFIIKNSYPSYGVEGLRITYG